MGLRGKNSKILVFGYVVLNKIYLIFQRLQIKKTFKKKSFFLNGTARTGLNTDLPTDKVIHREAPLLKRFILLIQFYD